MDKVTNKFAFLVCEINFKGTVQEKLKGVYRPAET